MIRGVVDDPQSWFDFGLIDENPGLVPYFEGHISEHMIKFLQWQFDGHAVDCLKNGRTQTKYIQEPDEISEDSFINASERFLSKNAHSQLLLNLPDFFNYECNQIEGDCRFVFQMDIISQYIGLDIYSKLNFFLSHERSKYTRNYDFNYSKMDAFLMPKKKDQDLRSFAMVFYNGAPSLGERKYVVVSERGSNDPLWVSYYSDVEYLPLEIREKYGILSSHF